MKHVEAELILHILSVSQFLRHIRSSVTFWDMLGIQLKQVSDYIVQSRHSELGKTKFKKLINPNFLRNRDYSSLFKRMIDFGVHILCGTQLCSESWNDPHQLNDFNCGQYELQQGHELST